MRRLLSMLIAGAFMSLPAPTNAQIEWNLANRLAESVFHTVNLRYFVKDVEDATNGELKITVHSSASLFRHPEIKRAVQTGQVEMGTISLSSFANEDEIFNFDSIPFMATTYYESLVLWEAARPIIEERLMRDGIRVLWTEPWPPQAFYGNIELKTLADLKGVKFRTYNRIGSQLAQLMGAQPVLIVASEVPQAFATGMVEAMVTSSAFGASVQAWDFVKVYNNVGAWLGIDETIINERAFQGLKPEFQKAILDAAAKAEVRGNVMSMTADDTAKRELEANGIILATPTDEFMAEVREVSKTMIDEWIKKAGPNAQKIVDRYNELMSRK